MLFGRVVVFFLFLLFGRCVVFAVWAGVVVFLLLGRCRVYVLLFGRWSCFFFFSVWAGACFFMLFGRGTGVHSFTGLPGSSLRDPTTKNAI